MRIFLSFIITLLLWSCGSTYVEYDYDKAVDFTKYKTYNYDWDQVSGFSEFDERRFIKSTDSLLQSRGWRLVENPQVRIAAQSSEYETASRNAIGVGLGGGGGNVGVGVNGGIPIGGRELHRALDVTFIDAMTNQVVWEAQSESDLKAKATPDRRDAYFVKLVTKIFKKYPPKK